MKNGNFDANELIRKIKQEGNMEEAASGEQVKGFLEKNFSPDRSKEIEELLGDKEKVRALLESDEAKELFKKLFGGR